jgi:hypothetical protein
VTAEGPSTPRTVVTAAAAPARRLDTIAWVLFAIGAVGVAVAGYLHGRLFHRGYAPVDWVGPLFLLNVIGSGIVVALLLLGRALAFAIGGLFISVFSLIAILISHSSSFLGFAEGRYDTEATVIVVAEAVAVVAILLGLALGRSRVAGEPA